jgi:hypothetical protein
MYKKLISCPNENGLFCQSLRQLKILILGILSVCLWLKFSFSLTLTKNSHFRSGTILFLLLFFLWIPSNIIAQTDKSVKINDDFVTKKGTVLSNRLDLPEPSEDKPYQPGHWRRPVTDDPHVVKDGNIYRMYLSGLGSPPDLYPHVPVIWSLGEATAPHPEGPWTITNNDRPLLSSFGWVGGWGGGHIISSMYMYDPIEKKGKVIYQCSTGEPEDGTKIGRTDADYPDEGSELFSAKAYTIADPFLVHDGKNYHLFYSKQVNNVWQTWKRKASNWEGLADASSAKCIMPSGGSSGLTNYKGTWYMVYSGWYDPGTPYDYLTHKNKLFLASSKDLETWIPAFNGNPIFEPDGIHDQYGAQDPCVFIEDDVAYIYYSGMKDPENNGENDTSICLVTMKLKDIKFGSAKASQKPHSKEWEEIKKIVSKQTVLSDDSRINAFADGSISSYKAEKYSWAKERLIIEEKITMVVLYDSENTCADELFTEIPDYLTLKKTIDIGYPVKFYSINDKLDKFKKKISTNNSVTQPIDTKKVSTNNSVTQPTDTNETDSKEWEEIKKIVSKQILLSDDSRINAFADGSVSSYKAEEYDWAKERLITEEKITMVVLYDSENTCADELFIKLPDYLTLKETIDIGYPVKFYSVNDKLDKLKKKASTNNSVIPPIDIKVSLHPQIFIKGYNDNYYLKRNRLETSFRPAVKLLFPGGISSGIEWKFKRIWDPEINQVEAYRSYIQFYKMFGSPLTLVLGRQELSFGRKFLMGELDGYDAVRFFLDTPLKVNLFAGTRNEGKDIFDFDERNDSKYYEALEVLPGDFEKDVYGLHFGYEFEFNVKSEAYIFYKEKKGDEKRAYEEGKTEAIGLRTQYEPIENLQFNAEITKQSGTSGENDRKAWGGYIQSIWKRPDTIFKPEFRFEYAYLSGNDPNTEEDEDFDLFSGDNLYSDIKWGRVRNVKKNMHIINVGISFFPYDTLDLSLFYSFFRRDHYDSYWKNGEGYTLSMSMAEGQELDFKVYYPITKYIAFSAFAGIFWPDEAYIDDPDNYKPKKQFELACQAKF